MKCTNVTKVNRKSGVAERRDLRFYGPFLEMFFDGEKPSDCQAIEIEDTAPLFLP